MSLICDETRNTFKAGLLLMSVLMTSRRLRIVRIPGGDARGAGRPCTAPPALRETRAGREGEREGGRRGEGGVCFHQIRVQLSDAAAIGAGYTGAPVTNRRPAAARGDAREERARGERSQRTRREVERDLPEDARVLAAERERRQYLFLKSGFALSHKMDQNRRFGATEADPNIR